MHKSIIIFSSLLMILLPLGTSMNISNANAIADFDNKEDRKQQVSSLDCNNINVNVNGLELAVFPPFLANSGLAAEALDGNTDPSSISRNGDGSEINDFRYICINNNNNTVIEEGPTTASLTVKKQIFGCDNLSDQVEGGLRIQGMECIDLQNNSTAPFLFLDCNNSNITNSIFCRLLPESIFDIEVLDDQNTQIQQFKGSKQGTTIQNLEPGTYTVNEIKNATSIDNQLGEETVTEEVCIDAGFTDGGVLRYPTSITFYFICFEYEDEQGNDCSTITLAAGESRTCTVKNYIILGVDYDID